ncbi:MAG: hypothetical protein US31_C0001G0004 [Berkelbacteria bacterium GW2011_GWA1_36_9]|uniref:DUF6922 domain-containing protein n=1 Tax=Berkelbacteria bacterium GW2011_GWA1_36_9 TaxID=1618331 RepID=A0A0G0FLX5_9BACT|nr:MAG: hypothetical protein US31_C0001G0004 [Berkelbacteria bacterium GW2011_GWA1_36_9]
MNTLPVSLKPMFWSYDFTKLNSDKDKQRIIINIINYGKWKDWQWLVDCYGKDEVKKNIETIQATEFRPEALKLISLLLDIRKFNYALRGSGR